MYEQNKLQYYNLGNTPSRGSTSKRSSGNLVHGLSSSSRKSKRSANPKEDPDDNSFTMAN